MIAQERNTLWDLSKNHTTFCPGCKVNISLGTAFLMLSIKIPATVCRIKSLRVTKTISRVGLGMANGRTNLSALYLTAG